MRALEGFRVLDLTHAIAGPLCTYHLVLQGADVIKIERPGRGDDLRHYTEQSGDAGFSGPFVAINGGKRSVVLDLKSTEGRDAVLRLAATVDVIVENFRPGVVSKLGIDYASVARINPDIVYCSISGFGANGAMKDWSAYDHIVQAISGLMWINGEPDQGPMKVGIPVVDIFTGYVSAFAIMTALLRRTRMPGPQQIDVGMLDAAMMMLAPAVAGHAMSGELPKRTGNRGFRLVAGADTYETQDGYLAIGANHQGQIESLCQVLGLSEMLHDERFATHEARVRNNDLLRERLATAFRSRKAAELEQQLAGLSVPAAMVRNLGETVALPHLAERDLFVNVRVPGVEQELSLAGAGFGVDHDGPPRSLAVPALGEHTEQVLAEISGA
ncbi:MAG: CaiB/BaiF CoA transferase family protein [Rhizobiaceae bacterium]